jgi:hypothetical protein
LEQATAEVLGNSKSRQVFLKRSLDTKDLREANIRAKPILVEFDMILALAEALTVQRPIRTTLEKREINQTIRKRGAANKRAPNGSSSSATTHHR